MKQSVLSSSLHPLMSLIESMHRLICSASSKQCPRHSCSLATFVRMELRWMRTKLAFELLICEKSKKGSLLSSCLCDAQQWTARNVTSQLPIVGCVRERVHFLLQIGGGRYSCRNNLMIRQRLEANLIALQSALKSISTGCPFFF